jgi:hypothetical protein
LDFTGYNFCLNIPTDYAPQDNDGITSTLGSFNWRLRERRARGIVRFVVGEIICRAD